MAGDWIKMRVALGDDPAVISIAAALDISEDEVVGKLHRLWSWADRHTTSGKAPGITPKWVDRYVAASGFSAAMQAAAWIAFDESGIQFPNFDRHNGQSAKTRGEAALRQRLSRKNRDMGVTGVTRDSIPRPFARHVLERDKYRCVYCGTQSDAKREASSKSVLSIDHIIPATRGGATVVANLVACCKPCNAEKNDRTPSEWGLAPEFLADGVTYMGEEEGMSVSQKPVTKSVTREEKRREEEKQEKRPRVKAAEVTLPEWIAALGDAEAITAADPLFGWAEKVGLPRDWIALAWWAFEGRYGADGKDSAKTYADWRKVFRQAVKDDWLRLWRADGDGWKLTTAGEQARRESQ